MEDWWTKTTEVGMDCKEEQLLDAAANLIETFPLQLSKSARPTISNRVKNQSLFIAGVITWSSGRTGGMKGTSMFVPQRRKGEIT